MVQLEGLKCKGGADEKKDEVTHIGMFRQQLARSFGHLQKRSSTGNLEASAAGDPSQDGHSSSSSDASNSRAASVQNLADGPLTDSNLATGPNPAATAAKLKVGRPEEARHHKHCCLQSGLPSTLPLPVCRVRINWRRHCFCCLWWLPSRKRHTLWL